ncbi:MAG: hypothetical protein ACFFKA_00055 [Candidatus Thorarchaeota archaeon]
MQLISEKTDALHSELDADLDNYDDVSHITDQIAILNELYHDVKLIQAEDE